MSSKSRESTTSSLMAAPLATISRSVGLLQNPARRPDVLMDLAQQRSSVGEALLVAEPRSELDAQRPAVQVAFEVEQMGLEQHCSPSERRPAPHVDDGRPEPILWAHTAQAGVHSPAG